MSELSLSDTVSGTDELDPVLLNRAGVGLVRAGRRLDAPQAQILEALRMIGALPDEPLPMAGPACGSVRGYKRHQARFEEPCEACRQALRDARMADIPHGTLDGFSEHRRRHAKVCDACLRARNRARISGALRELAG